MQKLFLSVILFIFTILAAISLPGISLAELNNESSAPQQGDGGPPPPGGPAAPPGPGGGNPQQFAQHKAEMIQKISNRIAEGQRVLACVQAAQNPEALRACKPEHEREGRGGGEGGGPR